MVKKIRRIIHNIFAQRALILLVFFAVLASVILARLFDLQILHGKAYQENFVIKTTRTKLLKSTRGNIYDCKGNLVAYNRLANAITIEDRGMYETTREKNLFLNGEIYTLTKMIRNTGSALTSDFHILLDTTGQYLFDTDNPVTVNRFRADVYGYQTVEELSDEEKSADAEKIIQDLASEKRFGLFNEKKPYTKEELKEVGLPETLSREEELDIIIVRYHLNLISYQRYMKVTVADHVTDETVAAVAENRDRLPDVEITEDYIREYNNAESMAPIVGYTGSPSAEELTDLKKKNNKYTNTSVIGKAGIEQYMETDLQGTDGSEEVIVNNVGRVLEENKDSLIEPIQGNNVYLTIDSDLQDACYTILEQRIAGIILTHLTDNKTVDREGLTDTETVFIPSYDIYRHMFSNGILDISHFVAPDASETEKDLRAAFEKRSEEVLGFIKEALEGESPAAYKNLTEEEQAYIDYLYRNFLTDQTAILDKNKIDANDETYQAFGAKGEISLREYLHYAANKGWINFAAFAGKNAYITADEIYEGLAAYIESHVLSYPSFQKIIYEYMLMNDQISPKQVLLALYDQGILNKEDAQYEGFLNGKISAYDLTRAKISSLELSPAMCAVDPCTGSLVLTDPATGEVRACVSYPGYDSNRLANNPDNRYYYNLTFDASAPFYNKATQQTTAPGSTFKPIMVAAGISEGAIDNSSLIFCDGKFGRDFLDEADQLNCWLLTGHGSLDVITALGQSCNVFFCTVGYRMGEMNPEGSYDSELSLSKIREYAEDFGLGEKTKLQMEESDPHISDSLPIPSSIGQGTHSFTTCQLARYAGVLATQGDVRSLTLLDKITDTGGTVLKTYPADLISKTPFNSLVWNDINEGMKGAMATEGPIFAGLPFTLYGKTGTAQEAKDRPSHSIVVGFCDYEDQNLAFAIRIAYGYGSKNACLVARDALDYCYALKNPEEILTHTANMDGMVAKEAQD